MSKIQNDCFDVQDIIGIPDKAINKIKNLFNLFTKEFKGVTGIEIALHYHNADNKYEENHFDEVSGSFFSLNMLDVYTLTYHGEELRDLVDFDIYNFVCLSQ